MAAWRWPIAHMPKLVVMQVISWFGVFWNMWVCRICRGSNAKISSNGISIAMGKSRAAFLNPNFLVSQTKILFLSLF